MTSKALLSAFARERLLSNQERMFPDSHINPARHLAYNRRLHEQGHIGGPHVVSGSTLVDARLVRYGWTCLAASREDAACRVHCDGHRNASGIGAAARRDDDYLRVVRAFPRNGGA